MSGAGEGAVRGWGCTPTEEAPQTKPRFIPAAFVRGWQRTTLYAILIVLMLLVFLNLALTLWIITSLRLSMTNIGPIRIQKGGIQLEGQALVPDRLVASTISSRPGQPITLHSHRNFSVLVSDPDHLEYSRLSITRDSMTCGGRAFEVVDARGQPVFRASREEVRVSSEVLAVDGEGGVTVRSSVQAPVVRAPPGSDLLLESQTRRLDVRAPQSVALESRAGAVDVLAHGNILLASTVGAIRIEAQNIVLTQLKEAKLLTHSSDPKSKHVKKTTKVYQVCVCAKSGKMFLAAPEGLCSAHVDDVDLCR